MDLLIDIGNTRIKWAMLDAGSLQQADATEHRADIAAAVDEMLERVATPPDRVIASNVAGVRFATLLGSAVHKCWDLPVQFAATQSRAGRVRNGYEDFSQLGVDRWLAMIAAADQFTGSVCIVDAGTAITIDAVTTDGMHLGGYIIPGFDLMRQSLGEQTGTLHRHVGGGMQQRPGGPQMLARSSTEAISAGILAAVCGLVDRCVGGLCERDGDSEPALLVTGGDAQSLLRHLDAGAHHRPQLVLEGLARYEFDAQALS